MPNPDPSSFQPPPALICEADFTDPCQPGAVWHFRFKSEPGLTTETRISRLARQFIALYVSPEAGKTPALIPPVGTGENRREIVASEELFGFIAALVAMQSPEDEHDVWNAAQWATFSLIAPSAFAEVVVFASRMSQEGESGAKN